MSIMLPKEINYDLPVSLPSGVSSMDVSISPVNGSTFSCATAGAIVQFDLPARGYSDFKTLSLRYKGTVVATGFSRMRGTPVYTPIQRLDVIFGSQNAQNIQDYNQVANMLTNLRLNVADKVSSVTSYGWKLEDDRNVMTLQGCDGRSCTATDVFSLGAPLPCILSDADRYIPTAMMPSIRIQLTLDSIANIFAPAVAGTVAVNLEYGIPATSILVVPTDYILSDFTLTYNILEFGSEIDNVVRSMGEKITIKSQSFGNSSNTIPIGSNGQQELIYSQKYASVKSLFLHCSSTGTNGRFDAFEVTNGGDVQFNIAGKLFPQSRPLSSAVANRATLHLELRKAVGSLYDKHNSMSINTQEFLTLGQVSTVVNPAKVYYGVSTEVIQSNSVLLSGISTQNSPITCRLNILQATGFPVNAALITAYDCLIEIEPATKSARVIM